MVANPSCTFVCRAETGVPAGWTGNKLLAVALALSAPTPLPLPLPDPWFCEARGCLAII